MPITNFCMACVNFAQKPGPLENENGSRAALGLNILTKVEPTRQQRDDPFDRSDEELAKILLGDRSRDLLMEKIFNQIPQAEMTEHLGTDRYERSEDRSSHRNGFYEQELSTRAGQLTLEVPRRKDGSFSTKLGSGSMLSDSFIVPFHEQFRRQV